MSELEITYRPLGDLIPYARNSRTHSEAQVAQIAASIREFGWTNPVLVDGSSGVIAGHGRILAARQLGMEQVPCIELAGMSEAQKRAYVIADNKLALNAGWDDEALRVEIEALKDEDFDLSLLGFGEDELQALLEVPEPITVGLTDEDDVPEVQPDPVSKPGDVWLLGKHRVMCGDSTSVDAVDRLMRGDLADVCLTDPPYGLGDKKASGKNDYATYVDSRENLAQLARDWLPVAQSVAGSVVFSPGINNIALYPSPDWAMCWFYGGGQLHSSWGFNCWQPFLCYGKDPSLASGNGCRPDAVNMNVPANAQDIDHPCPKPVPVWEWFIERLTFKQSAVVFDPFGGSGTTIIASEKLGRIARLMELDPRYVDVIVRRWQEFTGKSATLEADGRTFAEVEAA